MKNIDHDSPIVTITSKKEPISLFVHWYPYISCVGTVKKKKKKFFPYLLILENRFRVGEILHSLVLIRFRYLKLRPTYILKSETSHIAIKAYTTGISLITH